MAALPKVSNVGTAAAKLEKRQKEGKGVKPKEGYDRDQRIQDLSAGLGAFSSTPGSTSAPSGPADILQSVVDRKEAIAAEEAREANTAYQQELMARLRALTGGN